MSNRRALGRRTPAPTRHDRRGGLGDPSAPHAQGEEPMKAMVYRGPYKIRVEEKDEPRIEHP
ncbi:MAG TPA: hypothetical protein VF755_00075, partial [Catenuloplanes sp.]